MNGSKVNVSIAGSDALSATAFAAGKRITLTKANGGMWTAGFTYYDGTNPPPAHPQIDVTFMLPNGKTRTAHIPVKMQHA